jgi:8-oxo-dGTP pyrophosphatase MutT (NUDIX family)
MEKRTIIAGGGLVLNDAEELLMIYRRGKWDLPKGKLDEGETIEECAIREVEEETGVTGIERGELISIGYHEYFDRFLKEDVIKETHWYAMRVRGNQVLIPQTEEDITEIKWVKGEEMENCLRDSYDTVVEIVRKAGL